MRMNFREVCERLSKPGLRAYTRVSWKGKGIYYTKLEALSPPIFKTGSE